LLARPQKPKTHGEEKRIVPLGGVGLLSGLLGSLSGVGGEVIILPLLYRYLHVPLMRARGTSGAVLTASSLCGAFVYAATGWGNVILPPSSLGYVDGFCALPLLAGTALGVAFSMRLEARAATPVVRRVVAALLLILAFIVALA
jgi:uncharacterized membrane protein YfcA